MSEEIPAARFTGTEGVGDWRVLVTRGACAYFRTGSFSAGVALVAAIGRLVDGSVAPEVDLRAEGVFVRLADSEVELARGISAAARELGAEAVPAAVQDVNLTITTTDPARVRPFWRAVLGYEEVGDEDLADARGQAPSVWFQSTEDAGAAGTRLHVDVFVPHDEAEARVAAALAAGGRLVRDEYAPAWWTLADPDGNEADIATWQGREDDAGE
ncbi:VOC family protein [Amycolatopsis sacchari]|uniref:VOC family protein n=1 Tax=Amycolatopsis sacchari TaxID=115433 RepID=UPI003D745981